MKVRNTIADFNRRKGNSDRILETLENIFFKDKATGVIRMFDRKMKLVDESGTAEEKYNKAVKKGEFVWKSK